MVTQVMADNDMSFDYGVVKLKDMQVETGTGATGKPEVKSINIDGRKLAPTPRFWTSLHARYGISNSIFKYFPHEETFNRIADIEGDDRLRIMVETSTAPDGSPVSRLQAVSAPEKPVVAYDELMEVLGGYGGESVSYSDGIVTSMHIPARNNSEFRMVGDQFLNRYALRTPIDGYGKPTIYLALIRVICTNGMIAMTPVFKSEMVVGKKTDDVRHTFTRFLEGFNSDEGYAALRSRLEGATKSWCSVNEANNLYKLLVKQHSKGTLNGEGAALMGESPDVQRYLMQDGDIRKQVAAGDGNDLNVGSPIIRAFHQMTGDVQSLYGLANIDALSQKRQRAMPVRCSVYDFFNFITEVATHHADPTAAMQLQSIMGEMLTTEYDLEGTMNQFPEFQDFYVRKHLEHGKTGS